jgi:hypothetical protein
MNALMRDLASPATQMVSPVVTSAGARAWIIPGTLTGRAVRTLMRQHHLTTTALARRMRLPEKRVRQAREQGVTGWFSCSEWLQAMTGFWFIARPVEVAGAKVTTRRRRAA